MMKTIIKITFLLSIIIGTHGCSSMEDIYEEYIVYGGHVYPQKPTDPKGHSGDERVVLTWKKGVSSAIVKAVVSWDNGNHSREYVIDGNSKDVELVVDNLDERDYSFIIRTYDVKGNKSVPVEVNSLAYGESYKSSLYNRTINIAYIDMDKLVIEWNEADLTSGMTQTELRYTSSGNQQKTIVVDAKENKTLTLDDYKLGTEISYQSSFVPDTTCVDIFKTNWEVSQPLGIIDRSGWTAVASSYEPHAQLPTGGGPVEYLFDGDSHTYWHSQHADFRAEYPHWIEVDMKKPILIKRFIMQGRDNQELMFDHFSLQARNSATEEWTNLEEYDVYDRWNKNPQYYPVLTKQYYSQFKITMTKGHEFFAGLSEIAVLGLEKK